MATGSGSGADLTSGAQDRAEARSTTGTAVLVSVVAAIGGFLFGFDTAVINGAVTAISDAFSLSPFVTGLAVAVALLGSAVGAWYAGRLADRWGRVKVMLLGSALFLVSSVGAGLAFSVWDLVIWRFVGGLGIGIASVIAPAYIAEIAPARLRGRLGSLQQLAIVIGIFVALLSDTALARIAGGADQDFALGLPAWRWMFLVGVVPSVVYGVLALRIPESPRYLVAKGETQQASDVLRRVLGLQRPEDKVRDIQRTIQREDKPSLADLKGKRLGLMPVVWVGILLSVFQQFVGINVIFYYSTSLWQSVGFSESDSFTFSVITSVTNVVVTLVAIALVDKVGRRPLLLVGSAGMVLSLLAMTICFTQATFVGDNPQLAQPYGTIALIAANLYVVSFGVSWGPVVWVLLGEMFPNKIRAAALAVAAAAQWLAHFAITTTFPVMSKDIALWFAYGFYTVFAAISFFFVLTKVPETKGRELEDMDGEVHVRGRRPAEAAARTS
ncbi:MAG TPA: sugar porter family MFS transporter [Motilibacteraceae bacterium]|nr:sugar porter family MFS transporter [Motilibacteraceae bacterium]